jgi:Ti-type conjugative transfer relaxase TraA
MIARCVVGRGVTGAVRYILGEGRDIETGEVQSLEAAGLSRVAWIGGTGFGFKVDSQDDAELARRIMEFDALNQSSRTKLCEKDCVHLALGWRPGETPTREEMENTALSALKALGMENAKAIFASHTDEGYSHIHIVASKINPATGKAYDLRGNYLKLSKWAEAYEKEHGGVVCLRREDANRLRDAISARDPDAVIEAMTEQRATFTLNDLDRTLAKQIKGIFKRVQFGERVLADPNIVKLKDRAAGPTTRYTTRTVLKAEGYVLGAAEVLIKDKSHDTGEKARTSVLASRAFATIRPEQAAAVREATGSSGLALIDGQAGTGKSYTMSAIRQIYETVGADVIALAPTNVVVQDMQREGFQQAATVHSQLFALNSGRQSWNRRTVVMIDEAAMIDTKLMAMLTTHAHAAGAKLILVGDDRQLSSIERGGMFGALKDRYGAASLSEVTRQRKDDDKRASSMMAEGNFYDALQMYESKKAITWTQNQNQARAMLVKQWAADTAEAPEKARFVFAYTNLDVSDLNADLRAVRRARGDLGPDHILPTAEGERPFARGDRLQITATEKAAGLYNGMIGTVEKIEGTEVSVRFDGKQPTLRTFNAEDFPDFRHGYAGTIYKGQGRTLDQTYLYHSEHWRSAASYVALTRHRDSATLFVARNTAPDVRQLARQMARVDDRRAASHFINDDDSGSPRAAAPREVMAEFSDFLTQRVPRPLPSTPLSPRNLSTKSPDPKEGQSLQPETAIPQVRDEASERRERLRRLKADLERGFDRRQSRDRGRAR